VPGALDDAGVASFAFRVELPRVGDSGHDAVEELFVLVRGKAGSSARRMMRTARLNFTLSGSMPAFVAAVQIRALTA
jgi:hypothetical protein